MTEPIAIKQAFDRCLGKLTLKEFPCGNGKWRNNLRWESELLESKTIEDDASLFTNECLLELTDHEAFRKELDWSTDTKVLVPLSITQPKRKHNVLCKQFKTLRLVDQNISIVDNFITQFENLEELTLSANKISSFDSSVLPLSLRVLELCGNSFNSINFLGDITPKLYHVGLGYNYITSISDLSRQKNWDSLLSLDLSFNGLEDLETTIKTLKYIANLRVLLLQGNPLHLFMGYRGYVIDSLITLTALDDIEIFADERYQYKGISKLKDIPLNYSMIKIKIDNFQDSSRIDEMDSQADEHPKTFQKYQIQLDFIDNYYIFNGRDLDVDYVDVSSDGSFAGHGGDCEGMDNDDGNTIKSNNFELSGKTMKPVDFDKYVITNNTKGLTRILSRDIDIKLIENTVLMGNEPKPKIPEGEENQPLPKVTPSKKNTLSNGNVAVAAKKSVTKNNEKGAKDVANEKEKKKDKSKAQEELHELSRTTKTCGKCTLHCQALLSGISAIESDCLFTPPNETSTNTARPGKQSPTTTRTRDSTLPSIEIAEQGHEGKTQDGKDTQQRTSKSNASINANNKDIVQNASLQKVVADDEEVKTLPSAHFMIEVIRWNNTKHAIEWMSKFKISQ